MDVRGNPPDSVIEEIAAILASGYLRLCKARLSDAAVPSVQAPGEQIGRTLWHHSVGRPEGTLGEKRD